MPRSPAAALARLLSLYVFHNAPPGPDSLPTCPPDTIGVGEWEPDAYVGYVLPRVLGDSILPSDTTTALARATFIRVATTRRDTVGWVGELEDAVDTVEFTLQRVGDDWAVCGPGFKGHGKSRMPVFFMTWDNGSESRDAHWLPLGTTWATAAAHADSVVAARAHAR